MAKFYIFKDAKGEYRWRLRAGNGRIIADSEEGYVRKIDCEHSIELVKEESPTAPVEEVLSKTA
jgi:uncharacterized protein YegP (UPF0339 family)